jgi:signal peptidase I
MTSDATEAPAGEAGAVNETVEIVKTVAYALLIALALRVLLFQPYTIPSASMEPNLYEGDYIIVSKFSYGYSKHSIPLSPPLFNGRIFNHAPQRGDIIVFKFPRDVHGARADFIKRLVGLPGDHIQVKSGQVFINDKPIPRNETEPGVTDMGYGPRPVDRYYETALNGRRYLTQSYGVDGQAGNTGVYTVPAHCYFMMGDNRDNSLDSRFDPQLPDNVTGTARCAWDPSLDKYLPDAQPGVGFVPEEDLVGRAQMILLSWKPGASLFKPWTWVMNLRPSRFFHLLK